MSSIKKLFRNAFFSVMVRYFIGGIDVSCDLPLVSQRYFEDYAVIIRPFWGLLRLTGVICVRGVVVKMAGDPLLNVARVHTARKIYPPVISARFSRGPASSKDYAEVFASSFAYATEDRSLREIDVWQGVCIIVGKMGSY